MWFLMFAFFLGCIFGCIPIVGQIFGVIAYMESGSGNELSGLARAFVFGVVLGTAFLIALAFLL